MLVEEYALLYRGSSLARRHPEHHAHLRCTNRLHITIVLDLGRVREATIDAFADLIILRRRLLRLGAICVENLAIVPR